MALHYCLPDCSCTQKVKNEFKDMLMVMGPFWMGARHVYCEHHRWIILFLILLTHKLLYISISIAHIELLLS